MYCFVILLLFNEMQMSVRRFSAIPHLGGNSGGRMHKIGLNLTAPLTSLRAHANINKQRYQESFCTSVYEPKMSLKQNFFLRDHN